MNKLFRTTLTVIFLGMTGAAFAAPSLYTGLHEFQFSQTKCMRRAAIAVKAAGLTTRFEVVGSSTFGEQGDYTGLIRCIEEKKVVIFSVAGPQGSQSVEIGNALDSEFRRLGPNVPGDVR